MPIITFNIGTFFLLGHFFAVGKHVFILIIISGVWREHFFTDIFSIFLLLMQLSKSIPYTNVCFSWLFITTSKLSTRSAWFYEFRCCCWSIHFWCKSLCLSDRNHCLEKCSLSNVINILNYNRCIIIMGFVVLVAFSAAKYSRIICVTQFGGAAFPTHLSPCLFFFCFSSNHAKFLPRDITSRMW